MERNLFTLIDSNDLTKEKFDALLVAGVDLDKEKNEQGETVLEYACRLEKYDVIELLLRNCEDLDFETVYLGKAYEIAYSSKNVRLLAFLLKIAALDYKKNIENEKKPLEKQGVYYLDQNSSETQQIIKTIKARVDSDKDLQNKSELIELIDTINYVSLGLECRGGNADDQIDCTIVELQSNGVTHRFEYIQVDNWSFAISNLFLKWKTAQQEWIVLDLKSGAQDCILEEYAVFRMFAVDMGIGHLSFDTILKFFALVLSRRMQVFDGQWNKHPLLQKLDNSLLKESRFFKNPIQDLTLY